MTKKSYENVTKSKQKFICSNRCYNSEMPLFPVTDEIDFLDCVLTSDQSLDWSASGTQTFNNICNENHDIAMYSSRADPVMG